jgi:hypothetical protein
MDRSLKQENKFLNSLDEIPEDELSEIISNIKWFSKFSPIKRLETAKKHLKYFLYLKNLKEKSIESRT